MKPFLFLLLFINSAMAGNLSFKQENYFIKPGYVARTTYNHHDDTHLKDEYQDDIYAAAFALAKEKGYRKIGDIGCGSGYKLLKYFGPCETAGFEIYPTLTFLQRTYPSRNWYSSDFSRIPLDSTFDLLICSDVIEHVLDPDALLNWIDQFDFEYLVLSTPDRDVLSSRVYPDHAQRLQCQSGPPVNWAHAREWNFQELELYISQYFDVEKHFRATNDCYGQVIIAKKKEAL